MDTIILYGDKKDAQIKTILLHLLSQQLNVNLISDNVLRTIEKPSTDRFINLVETSYLNGIYIKNAILILKSNAKINAIKFIDKSTNVIINAQNTKNIERLAKCLGHVYTCGFSSKDYATFSSKDDDRAVFSLQRSVQLTGLETCEPLELPCQFNSGLHDYSILSSVLALLLLNIIDTKHTINLI